jgi:hypothetical protein
VSVFNLNPGRNIHHELHSRESRENLFKIIESLGIASREREQQMMLLTTLLCLSTMR